MIIIINIIIIIIIIIIIFLDCRWQLESIILHNHEDTMSKTGAILHCGIVAAGERDVIIRHSHHHLDFII